MVQLVCRLPASSRCGARPSGDRSYRTCGLFIVAGWVAVFCLIMCVKSHAHDDGTHANDPLHAWFDQLASGRGLCCSFADGVSIAEVDWDNLGTIDDVNSGYRVRLDGQWIDVPKNAVITEPNKDGRTFVWPHQDSEGKTQIRCFMPGAGA